MHRREYPLVPPERLERFRRGINRNDFELRKKFLQTVPRAGAWLRGIAIRIPADRWIADYRGSSRTKNSQHLRNRVVYRSETCPFRRYSKPIRAGRIDLSDAFEQPAPGVGLKTNRRPDFCAIRSIISLVTPIYSPFVIDHVEGAQSAPPHADERVLPDPSALVRCQSDTGFHLPGRFR